MLNHLHTIRRAAQQLLAAHKKPFMTWRSAWASWSSDPRVRENDYIVMYCPYCGAQFVGLADLAPQHKHETVNVPLYSALTLRSVVLKRFVQVLVDNEILRRPLLEAVEA